MQTAAIVFFYVFFFLSTFSFASLYRNILNALGILSVANTVIYLISVVMKHCQK